MAALSATQLGNRKPVGDVIEETWKATTGVAAADEWIATGLSEIESVVGAVVNGAATSGLNFLLNAQGTGETEDDDPGDLGIEAEAAVEVIVTVRGRL